VQQDTAAAIPDPLVVGTGYPLPKVFIQAWVERTITEITSLTGKMAGIIPA
jgi:hypothetical protein